MTDLHERIKTLIKNSDHDYKSLSLEIGQGERYISNLLSTKSDPGFTSIIKICASLGVTPNQIAGLNDQLRLVNDDIDTRIEVFCLSSCSFFDAFGALYELQLAFSQLVCTFLRG